jgi:Fe-S cluster assembly scaffold protein SufB
MSRPKVDIILDRGRYDDANVDKSLYVAQPGVTKELVLEISKQKNEPDWMLQKRLQAFELFEKTPVPTWGPDLGELELNQIVYYVRPDAQEVTRWEDLPEDIRRTAERIGVPEAERKMLGGAGFQYDSGVVYHNLKKDLEDKGVIFENMDVAVQKYPDMVKKYFMTKCVPINDHKFVMLHGAVWSGGTFIYVPPGVKVDLPLQAYFRMNAQRGGQFEHTLIIADKGSEVSYVEGCSSPIYTQGSLHAGCVELFVMEGAKIRYMSIENWSKNTYNLNTKRAIVEKNGRVEWLNGNMGCLVSDTKVFTNPKGPTRIKDLKVGDHVYALDEREKKIVRGLVKALIYSGEKEVFKVEAGGRSIEASANHPFLVMRHKTIPTHKEKGKFYTEWTPLEDIKMGDMVAITKDIPDSGQSYYLPIVDVSNRKTLSSNQYTPKKSFPINLARRYNPISLPEHTTEDFMWFIGLYIGDGYFNTPAKARGAKINIAIHEQTDLREPLLKVIKNLFNYEVTHKKDRFIEMNSTILYELFEKLELIGTAKTKRVPLWVYTLPLSQKMAFLAGYFDSDGHVGKSGVYFTSISKNLLEDVKLLALDCGLNVSRIFNHRKAAKMTILGNICNASDSYRLLISGKRVFSLPTKSKSGAVDIQRISAKRNYVTKTGWNFKQHTSDSLGFAPIKTIESVGIKPTYDIEVEGFHNFVANGIIVHNSHRTMLYPCSVLVGEGASSDSLGIAFAGPGQHQDTGSKVIHAATGTSSIIRAKSISKGGGISSYRGLVKVTKNAQQTKSSVTCDALLLDSQSASHTYPFMKIDTNKVDIAHEATVGKIGEEEIFYLMSRGLTHEQALQTVVSGFIEPIVRGLPLEYAVELNKLIALEMEGAVG